jgi:hypothetical protein
MVRFNQSLLTEIVQRDGATIVGVYEALCQKTQITYICKCGTQETKRFHSLQYSAGAICRPCGIQQGKEKKKQTNLAKFGVEYPCQKEEYMEKQRATMLAKYGVTNALKSDAIKQKVKATNLQKYGVPSATKSAETRAKMKESLFKKYGVQNPMQSEIIRDKIIHTNMEKYGVANPMQAESVKKKLEETSLAKYGTKRPSQSTVVRDKMASSQAAKTQEDIDAMMEKTKLTSLKKYGTVSPNHSDIVKERKIQSSLAKYGTEYPMQNSKVQEKLQNCGFKRKEYTMPSGAVHRVQGYEPYALDLLLKDYTEDQIITDRKGIPRIPYTVGDKARYYFPDIFIPHTNTIIEVKSTWTYACTSDNVQLKADATRAAGYNYETWIFDGKGKRISELTIKSYS